MSAMFSLPTTALRACLKLSRLEHALDPALRACLKLSRLEHALEAHAGHEQRGEHGHVPRGVGARLVVDPQAAVALQAAEGLRDLPAPFLELEARAVPGPDDLGGDGVAVQEGLGLVAGEAAV